MRRILTSAGAATLLAAIFVQEISALRWTSAVVDEPAHLTAGYLSLVSGDLRINREHPPLLKALAALPLLICMCARCVDEITGERIVEIDGIDPLIAIESMQLVGNYALRIHWSDGHHQGLYTWRHLRELCENAPN